MSRALLVRSALSITMMFSVAGSALSQTPADSGGNRRTAPETELPLIPTRPLKFTTDEGTWLSLDVSPDGRTIVFDLLGDLYTIPIGGGSATRITSGSGFDGQPRFSPDGKSIVFVSDRSGSENLYLVDPNGQRVRPLTRGPNQAFVSPDFTPDGQYIVASKGGDLWLYHKDGGNGLRLTGQTPPQPQQGGPGVDSSRTTSWARPSRPTVATSTARRVRVRLATTRCWAARRSSCTTARPDASSAAR